MIEGLTAGVHAAMREASERAILPRYQALAAHEVTDKAADDVVTVADHESEAILSEKLAALLPEAAIVGEEAAHDNPSVLDQLSGPLTWIVDPLDGTNNFAVGKPPFGVLVALAQHGETVAGWILDSLTGRFCHASAGRGAFIDGERITARASGKEPPIAAIGTYFMTPEKREAVKLQVAPYYHLVDVPRCAAEQYPRLVLGENDVSIFERTYAWDHAAGVLFLNEAGGKVTRADGTPYRADGGDYQGLLGASNPALWDDLAERMARLDGN